MPGVMVCPAPFKPLAGMGSSSPIPVGNKTVILLPPARGQMSFTVPNSPVSSNQAHISRS